jgi:hypothetical protein
LIGLLIDDLEYETAVETTPSEGFVSC